MANVSSSFSETYFLISKVVNAAFPKKYEKTPISTFHQKKKGARQIDKLSKMYNHQSLWTTKAAAKAIEFILLKDSSSAKKHF